VYKKSNINFKHVFPGNIVNVRLGYQVRREEDIKFYCIPPDVSNVTEIPAFESTCISTGRYSCHCELTEDKTSQRKRQWKMMKKTFNQNYDNTLFTLSNNSDDVIDL